MSQIEELQEAFKQAQAACEAYSAQVVEKYRAELPDSPEWRGPGPDPDAAVARARAWTVEERTELARLRREATEAALALHRARSASVDT